MSPAQITSKQRCPFDWEGDVNNQLRGGTLLGHGAHMFGYYFTDSDGVFLRGLIAPKTHYPSWLPLPPEWAQEAYELECRLNALIGVIADAKNVTRNAGIEGDDGHIAGERVYEHWHTHALPRFREQPASNMGLGLLIAEYNSVMDKIATLAAGCSDPETTAELQRMAAKRH